MEYSDKEKQIIESYQNDERMMIFVYAQWCINNQLDPFRLYGEAYPDQRQNQTLSDIMELTVPGSEAGEINNQTVLNILQLYGNDDLAFIVQREIEKREK